LTPATRVEVDEAGLRDDTSALVHVGLQKGRTIITGCSGGPVKTIVACFLALSESNWRFIELHENAGLQRGEINSAPGLVEQGTQVPAFGSTFQVVGPYF
jgi:hypothetical protein